MADPFVNMFSTFLEVLIGTILAFTGYQVYERKIEKDERSEIMKSLVDVHHISTMESAIDKAQKKQEASSQQEKK